jgi:hypothetical protein
MQMKRALVLLLASGLLPLNGCGGDDDGGSDAVALCREAAATLCSKFFGCYTKEQLSAATALVGKDEADCVAKYTSSDQFNCTVEGTKCDAGETYDSGKANECVSEFKAITCSEITSGNISTPAACEETCK